MQFRILGSLEIADGEGAISLKAPKQRALLAVLLLYPNEVVSTERLVDELWGEHPPATAVKVVQTYVSQLRRGLGQDVIETRPPGYLLHVEEDALDADRFRRLAGKGRLSASNGQQERADSLFREALALWRGPPLADVSFESFARSEVERLAEERLEALAARIDCELAMGRHHELTAELESLVKQYPLRERLRAQLLLALYRSGRQADALAAYQDARRTLVEELGVEPGRELRDLEQAILRHDPSLDLPAQLPGAKRRRMLTVIPALGIAAVVAVALSSVFSAGSSGLSAISPNAVGVIDPGSNELVAEVPVGIRPGPVSVGKGSVWVLNLDDETVSRIDPKTRTLVGTLGTDGFPSEIASAGRSAWVIIAAKSKLAKVAPGYRGTLDPGQIINPVAAAFGRKRGQRTATPLGSLGCPQVGNNIRFRAVVGGGDLWFVCGRESLSASPPSAQLGRLSLPDGAVTNVSPEGGGEYLPTAYADVTYARGLAWVLNWASNSVFDVDPRTNWALLTRAITVGKEPVAIAAGADSLWIANFADDTVSRIDLDTRTVTTIGVGDGPVDVAFGEGAPWVANSLDHSVSRIDPETNEVTATIDVGREPLHVAAGEAAVWVTTAR